MPVALCDDLIFALVLRSRLAEGLLVSDLAAFAFAFQLQIPVLGKVLRERETFLLGAGAAVLTAKIG